MNASQRALIASCLRHDAKDAAIREAAGRSETEYEWLAASYDGPDA